MASSTKTPKIGLSQFVASDKPSWLTDYNSDMQKIDAQVSEKVDKTSLAGASVNYATQSGNTNTIAGQDIHAIVWWDNQRMPYTGGRFTGTIWNCWENQYDGVKSIWTQTSDGAAVGSYAIVTRRK